MKNTQTRYRPGTLVVLFILLLGSGIMIIPFAWMILTSFKTFQETLVFPIKWLPASLNLANYEEVLEKLNFGRYYLNTIFITVTITLVQVFFCTMAAYGFGRLVFPGRNIIFILLLSMLMIPQQMILIPAYVLLGKFHWIDTFYALTIPHFFSAYGTFFLRQFFMTLPKDLEESAIIDGCSHFRVYWSIVLPLCGTAIAAFSIFTVLWAWNDLVWPLIMSSKDSVRVLSVGIATLMGQHNTKNNLLMAASVLATTPMVVLFIICQKQFIAGIAVTGMKV